MTIPRSSLFAILLIPTVVFAAVAEPGAERLSSAVHGHPHKLAPHLYSIVFERYDFGYVNAYAAGIENALRAKAELKPGGGCSICRRGDVVGRNFDWFYDDTDEFLVQVPAIPGERHASVGVAAPVKILPGQSLPRGAEEKGYEMVPFFTADGVNDVGVFCGSSLMPDGDESGDTGTLLDDPTARPICGLAVVRFVLDYADSARHAVGLLEKVSIRKLEKGSLAWAIADQKDTFVVEVISNRVNVINGDKAKTLTNFYLSKSPVFGRPHTPHANGLERYEILSAKNDGPSSPSTMLELMKSVFFSLAYREGYERKRWSEMNDEEYENGSDEAPSFSFYDDPNPESWIYRRRMKEFADARAKFKRLRECEKLRGRREEESCVCHTTHSAVYDLSERRLYLRIQEQDRVYEAEVGTPPRYSVLSHFQFISPDMR